MYGPVVLLLGALGGFTAYHVGAWWLGVSRARSVQGVPPEAADSGPPSPGLLSPGFVTDFLHTLGIGSFAPTTSAFKFFRLVPDHLIPGTLNVGHTLPTIAQAFICTAAIEVDPLTRPPPIRS